MRSESNPASRSDSRQNPHPLTAFFEQAVRNSYEGRLGLHDPEVTEYVARLRPGQVHDGRRDARP